jgi:NAD(P)-dependent dehydrogenase (short-subunit alcohol dehydrogenase family)
MAKLLVCVGKPAEIPPMNPGDARKFRSRRFSHPGENRGAGAPQKRRSDAAARRFVSAPETALAALSVNLAAGREPALCARIPALSDLVAERPMPTLSRRHLLAATGAAAAAAAAPACAQEGKPLAGKTFLITGTSSGFGALGAPLYARQGAKVFATMRNLPRPEADELERIARAEKLDLQVLELDVLSDAQVQAAVAQAETRSGGPIDVLVNNAGIVIDGPVEVQDLEATRLVFDTNVWGYQRLARAVLPGMRRRRSGLIVNVSSQVGRVILPSMGLYSATKFAVESMSEQLAYELAPHGIDVVIIQPGGYPTRVGANRDRYTGALRARAEPQHTDGYPEQVARMGGAQGGGAARAPAVAPGQPDPIDVPQAIAEIAALPAGQRPLRRPVHPSAKPQEAINKVSAETQLMLLGGTPYGPWARAVLT